MKFLVLTAILAVFVVSSLGTKPSPVPRADSKRSLQRCGIDDKCGDFTSCSPFCSYGACNIFGCECDGASGCRLAPTVTKQYKKSWESKKSYIDTSQLSDFFDVSDENEDGKMSFEEWVDSPVRSSLSGDETRSMQAPGYCINRTA